MTAPTLCIGPGGIRALALVGCLQELDLKAYAGFAGISMGSFMAMCLAVGYTPADLEELVLKVPLEKMLQFGLSDIFSIIKDYGLYDATPFRLLIRELLRAKQFSEKATLADVPTLTVVVSNMNTRAAEAWTQKEDVLVEDAIVASCAIPLLFKPVLYNSHKFVDGCLFADCASQLVPGPCLALHVMNTKHLEQPDSFENYFMAVLHEPRRARSRDCLQKLEGAGTAVLVNVTDVTTLDIKLHTEEKRNLILKGREAAKIFLTRH
jgi:NTE family protein